MAAVGEDSSRQDMKKNMRWERIEDAEGMRSRADLNRDYTTGPADGSDRTRDLSLGSAGRDQVLQHTVSGACWRGLHPMKKGRKKHRGS